MHCSASHCSFILSTLSLRRIHGNDESTLQANLPKRSSQQLFAKNKASQHLGVPICLIHCVICSHNVMGWPHEMQRVGLKKPGNVPDGAFLETCVVNNFYMRFCVFQFRMDFYRKFGSSVFPNSTKSVAYLMGKFKKF